MDRAFSEWNASITSVASRPSYQSIQCDPAGCALRHPFFIQSWEMNRMHQYIVYCMLYVVYCILYIV